MGLTSEINHSNTRRHRGLDHAARWLWQEDGWEIVVLLVLIIAAPILVYLNLDVNPRPWGDEGGYLALAKTLATDGVYAVRTSDGYQTFGAVQSLGPTVILPVALSFKLFGAGLLQGRIVTAGLALLTLVVFYACGLRLFGRRSALFGVILLLASGAAAFLPQGRGSLGEIPALGFVLAGWLAWVHGLQHGRRWLYPIAGLLMGAGMVTKSHYLLMCCGALALLACLGIVYYRKVHVQSLFIVGGVALACVVVWWLWQMKYYGLVVFQENMAKMSQLTGVATGFHLHTTLQALNFLTTWKTQYFSFFWGFCALAYGAWLCLPRDEEGWILAFLWLFGCLWLAYYIFWITPWPRYLFPGAAIAMLLAGKLASDLFGSVKSLGAELLQSARRFASTRLPPTPQAVAALGALVALLTLGLLTAYQLQSTLRLDVLDRSASGDTWVTGPPEFGAPQQLASFLNANVDQTAVIDTWERELSILTNHRYHLPDQSLLTRADASNYRGTPRDYVIDAAYLQQANVAYVVVGWNARDNQAYDQAALAKGKLLATIGTGKYSYDVYKMNYR